VEASRPAHLPFELEVLVGGTALDSPPEAAQEAAGGQGAPGAVDLPGSERIELAPQAPPSQEELDEPASQAPDETEPTD